MVLIKSSKYLISFYNSSFFLKDVMKKIVSIFIWIFITFTWVPGMAEELRIAVIESPLLSSSKKEEGLGYGMISDLLLAAGKLADVQIVFEFYPLQRAYTYFFQKKIPFTYGHPQYFQMFFEADIEDFGTIPMLQTRLNLYYYKKTFPDGFKFETFHDWKGYQVGTMRGGALFVAYKKAGIDIHLYNSFVAGFRMLKANRIQLLEMPAIAGRHILLEEFKDEIDDFASAEKPTFSIATGLIYRIDNKKSITIAKKIAHALNILRENGRYQEILEQYWKEDSGKELMP